MPTDFQPLLNISDDTYPRTAGTWGFSGTITHQYALRKRWILLRFEQVTEFACSLCKQQKQARLVAVKGVLTITAAAVVVSAAGYSGLLSLYHYIFVSQYVFTVSMLPQLWRLFTAFLITKPKFGILLDPYFLYQYGSSIERESPRFKDPGDFFVYTLFLGSVIVATAGGILNQYTFLPSLSLAYAYTFAQDNPTRSVSFFVITFESKYLPFAMLFMAFVMDGPDAALGQLMGLLAAHLYDFLTRIWPTFGGGKNYIRTPEMVKRWFGAAPGSVQNRGYGHVVQGRGGAAQPSAARATGNAWGGMGPGRRLGE
ncbi:uncharacterized protein J4E87_010552 [Alternaria ethzedia]|uniref:uncharacterized protein n=1 Tax=Alternaria ethzedia TaxID=181014 RepID=UPI0020C2B292|nr:uncharacterized protein J4E87_010552 [Alternaria ethzedia]KAI4611268.1 hypothetical protein J4E87_010552 [Alternaria ethzedia]